MRRLMMIALILIMGCTGNASDPGAELIRESRKASARFAQLQAQDAILTPEIMTSLMAPVSRAVDAHARELDARRAQDPASPAVAELYAASAVALDELRPIFETMNPNWQRLEGADDTEPLPEPEPLPGEPEPEPDTCDVCLEEDLTCESECGVCPVDTETEIEPGTEIADADTAPYLRAACRGLCTAAYLICTANRGNNCGEDLRICKRNCRCKKAWSN